MGSKYEAEVYHCMDPTLELYERTTDLLHRAILLNYWRHVHLEGAAMFEEITAPDMMGEDPVYHITWGENPFQVRGRQGVYDFYASIGDIDRAACRRAVEERFTVERMAEEYLALYRRVLS